jgi:DNA-binding response OmpR family regulator
MNQIWKYKKPFILIIDDNPTNLQFLEIILKKANYEIAVALSGFQAFKIIKDHHPDLILLDVMMPKQDGYEVCEIFKSSPKTKDIPIIFLTAKTETKDILKGFELGAVDFITKPFDRTELLARIKTQLELKQSQERLKHSYRDLKNAQEKMIELERTNSVLAMAATTNHELNQPLTVLTGNLYLLEKSIGNKNLTETQKIYIEKINNSIIKLQSILTKYRNPASIQFEKYAGNSNMVVFNKKKNLNKNK